MAEPPETLIDHRAPLPRRRSFRWRGDTYRLDTGTWHFWGGARLIRLPGEPPTFRMTPDDELFVSFGLRANYVSDADDSNAVTACQTFLEQSGYQVWTVQEALDIVRADADPALSEQLMDRLIYFFFLAKV